MSILKPNIKMVIFDCDGVIFDSEPLHYRAKLEILHSYGLRETFNLEDYVGKPNKDLWTKIIKENKLNTNPDELEMQQFNLILGYVYKEHLSPTNGLVNLLDILKESHITTAVASSSNRYYVSHILKYFGIDKYFSYSVTGDEVMFQKPSPDIYKKTLQLSGIFSENAIAIEDSTSGVRAAVSAGIKCLGYQNPTSGMQDLSLATGIIQELGQVVKYITNEAVEIL